ncbi:sensor histidine kinase [Neptunomonas qingdaonensis]|uniref:histidine kinase n=1 Tax=Neptunomonas qingdaonensis TaxID=1045558 RepID=A0A1I2RDH3_9GAMM|nr:ATP-binding protein [Neptunomonas qingdaonensis]SFG38765.1 His Kinase A (phospho-acceptor) domain-containing protein [Neptunomonas qingdaonensis]
MTVNPYKIAYQREKKARLEAEQLLEDKARSLYITNQELIDSNKELKKHQAIMLRNEKLATIGTLSAGIAHEINNPLAFISSNLEMLNTYWASCTDLFSELQRLIQSGAFSDDIILHLNTLIERYDMVFIHEDTPELLADTVDGLVRVKEIVQNLRSFARSQPTDYIEADINQGIQNTLKILNSQIIDARVSIRLDLQPISSVMCNSGEINQVLLSLIVNATQAMEESPTKKLTISSRGNAEQVEIILSDTGCGIPQDKIDDIFSPFFTTKDVDKGTGMGLSIAHSIIGGHGGEIDVTSKQGQGTTFTIKLPTMVNSQPREVKNT